MAFEATARAERDFARAGENLRSLFIAKLKQFATEPEDVRWRHFRIDRGVADHYGTKEDLNHIGRIKANRRFRIVCTRTSDGLKILGFTNRSNQAIYRGEL